MKFQFRDRVLEIASTDQINSKSSLKYWKHIAQLSRVEQHSMDALDKKWVIIYKGVFQTNWYPLIIVQIYFSPTADIRAYPKVLNYKIW